jgi:hypothetical protein
MTAGLAEREAIAPAYLHIPERVGSRVEQVARLARSCGFEMDAEERLAVDVLTSFNEDGTPSVLQGAVIVARQNLKTFILVFIVLDAMLDPGSRIDFAIWSAHEWDAITEAFLFFKQICQRPNIAKRISKIYEGSGNEAIWFENGHRLKFKARSAGAMRSMGVDLIVLDEAYALQEEHMGALVPTMATKRYARLLYGSSHGRSDSVVLAKVVKRGRAGRGIAYVEWRAPGSQSNPGCEGKDCTHAEETPGCALDDPVKRAQANPALGSGRIPAQRIDDERSMMTPKIFMRERMGWEDEVLKVRPAPITGVMWSACADESSRVHGSICLAISVSIDRKTAAIGIAGPRVDGIRHLEVIRYGSGTHWVVAEVAALVKRNKLIWIMDGKIRKRGVVIDPGSPTGSLLPDLKAAGIDPYLMTTRDYVQACAALQDDLETGRTMLRHIGQAEVQKAVEGATRRDVGDSGWAFGRKAAQSGGVDICPLEVLTVARWGLSIAAPAVKVPLAAWA